MTSSRTATRAVAAPPAAPATRTRISLARPAADRVPEPETAARLLVVRGVALLALAVSVAYLLWRAFGSLAGTTLWLSVPLLVLEAHALVSLVFFTHDLWDLDGGRRRSSDAGATSHLRVALLVPTYDEPRSILLPTVAAAVATHRAHETWVLDDGDRPWVRELAESLGARYRSRRNGAHAKAGNLNEALADLDVDLVAVVDADHVVTPGFLDALVPYFADPDVALVQTPQDFYNDGSFEHAARPDGRVFQDQEMFYRAILAGRNRWEAAFWCGTGAVLRVEALRSVGGVATDSVTEDIQTTLRLHRAGWRTLHHNEVVARGLAADGPDAFFIQRSRWGAGAMQVLRRDNPLTGAGLSAHQRVSYLSTLLGWFDSWRTIGYVLLPIATVLSGGLPVAAPWRVFLVAFLVSFGVQRVALRQLSRGRAPLLHATLFEFVRLPATAAATMSLFTSGPRQFRVTPKGARDDRVRGTSPTLLLVLITASGLAAAWYVATLAGVTPTRYDIPWVAHGAAAWLVVNAFFLLAAERRVRDLRFAGNRRASWRFPVEGVPVRIETDAGTELHAVLDDVSLAGARIVLPATERPQVEPGTALVLHLPIGDHGHLAAPAVVRSVGHAGPSSAAATLAVGCALELDTADQARLALALYRTTDGAPAGHGSQPEASHPDVPHQRGVRAAV